jgi:hypothetical protein
MMGPRARWIAASAGVAYAVLLRPRLLTWGATHGESTGVLPGDDLLRARWQTTRAVAIAAPPEDVAVARADGLPPRRLVQL